MKKRLEIEREQEHATIAQVLNLAEAQADAKAKTAQKQEEAQRLSEQARIEREMEIQVAEIHKDKSLEKERQEAHLSKEIHRVEMAVALAQKQKQEAEVIAETEQVKAKVVMVQERVQTEREKVIVEREREIGMARSQKDAAILMAKTKSQTDAWLVEAETKAQNIERQAQADKMRMAEEAQGRSALIQAENLTSEAVLRQRLEIHRLDKLPELAAQMMKPVEKIDSIRINHIGGLESGRRQASLDGTQTTVANNSPINQVVNSILDMALQMPVLQRVGDVLGADVQSALTSKKTIGKE
jgi:flotillin